MHFRHSALLLSIFACSAVSQARDPGQYEHVSPEIKSWVESLKDEFGMPCCATADGYRPGAVDWDMGRHHYRVKIDNKWIEVPDGAVIKGPNRIGFAIVRLYGFVDWKGDRVVRCFLPGPES